MTRGRLSLQLPLAILLAIGALWCTPHKASAYGWYHYMAYDTLHHNVWPSQEPIKRMYWHHTSGGWGVSVKMEAAGKNFDWVWFPITDLGSGVFVGYTKVQGCELYLYVARFNELSWNNSVEYVTKPGDWSRYAWLHVEVRSGGKIIGSEAGGLEYHTKCWTPCKSLP